MDPTNSTTPTPAPAPTPAPTPTPDVAAVPSSTPAPSDPLSATGFGNPAAAAAPDIQPPVASGAPTNPVIQPSGAPATPPAAPPVNPVIRPSGLGVTEPIMMPDKPAEPDPVEEELKAPMKAAGPVPGSIGSAISGPAGGAPAEGAAAGNVPPVSGNPFANADKPTPSVSFNDPAAQPTPDANVMNSANQPQVAKKKTNKNTLIALIAVAAVIVVVLIVILVMQLMPSGNSQGNGASGGGGNVAYDIKENEDVDENEVVEDNGGLDTDTGTAAFMCVGEQTTEPGQTVFQKMSFMVSDDNKLEEIKISSKISDAEGNELQNNESSVAFDALSKQVAFRQDVTSQYVGEDGTLLVSVPELAMAMQNALNSVESEDSENAIIYSCSAGK